MDEQTAPRPLNRQAQMMADELERLQAVVADLPHGHGIVVGDDYAPRRVHIASGEWGSAGTWAVCGRGIQRRVVDPVGLEPFGYGLCPRCADPERVVSDLTMY